MDKTIEKEFFKAFEFGGVVSMCFDWMQQKYDLGVKSFKYEEDRPKMALPDKWRNYYDNILPKRILELTEAFDETVIMNADSPLMNEIEDNLDECKTDKQKERYIFSLLKPFKEFSDKFNPDGLIRQFKGEFENIVGISDCERDLAKWNSRVQEGDNEAIRQVNACKEMIENLMYRIERVRFVADKYRAILHETVTQQQERKTVESCLVDFHSIELMYANRLDALLLEHGFNLLWYQRESGIYLKSHRCITDVDFYIGSHELARKYIDEALPKLDTQAQVTEKQEYEEKRSNNASQNTPSEPTKRKGRPKGQFKDKMICENVDEVLKKLHSLMNDRQGREAALIITACIKAGIITKPTFTQVTDEFGNIGNVSGFNKYMREKPFSEEELKAIVDKIKE